MGLCEKTSESRHKNIHESLDCTRSRRRINYKMPEFKALCDGNFIPAIPDEIIRAAQNEMLVVFVGAGVSRLHGCPAWDEYARKKIDCAVADGLVVFEEAEYLKTLPPRTAITICKSMYKEKQTIPKLSARELLRRTKESSKILEHLYAWKAIYITTNYDDFLDEVARSSWPPMSATRLRNSVPDSEVTATAVSSGEQDPIPFNPISERKSPLILPNLTETAIADLKAGSIIHLHGCVTHEKDMIETVDEYIKYYTGLPVSHFLDWVFANYVVVFVGYGLTELEILEYIIRPRGEELRRAMCFVLWGCRDREGNLAGLQSHYFASMGVKSIPFPIWKNGYDHLEAVVSKWSQQLSSEARGKDCYHRIQLIEEVTPKAV
jgi:hypothetical protein